jgi:hypothetical protein
LPMMATTAHLAGAQGRLQLLLQDLNENVPDPAADQGLKVMKVPWRRQQLCSRMGHGVFLRFKPKRGLGLGHPENTPFLFFNKSRESSPFLDPKQARLVSVVRCLHLAPMEGFLAGEGRAET